MNKYFKTFFKYHPKKNYLQKSVNVSFWQISIKVIKILHKLLNILLSNFFLKNRELKKKVFFWIELSCQTTREIANKHSHFTSSFFLVKLFFIISSFQIEKKEVIFLHFFCIFNRNLFSYLSMQFITFWWSW